MSMETSALPPLDSTLSSKTSDLESSNGSTCSEHNNQEIKRNILQIYPRLQTLEKDINNIKQQIPSELNKNILQVRRNIFELKEKSVNHEIDANDSLSRLKDLENQMNFKVDSYIDDFLLTFNKNKTNPKMTQTQLSFLPQNDFDKKLNGINNIFNQYNKSTEQRISNLEQKIAKLSSQSTRLQSVDNIEKMRKSVQQQNIQLSELNLNLNTLIQNSQQTPNTDNSFFITHPINFQENNTSTKTSKKDIPDLTEPIRILNDQIQSFKNNFTNSLIKAQEKTQKCKNRLAEVKDMANEIKESAAGIESKVIEVNNLCDSLTLQIKEMSQNLSQNNTQRAIDSISAQIKGAQDRIISELDSIKKRLKKCEMSEPLIETNSSKALKKPKNNKTDDDSQLQTVTFGKIAK